jgi:hypothetical protein
MTARQLDLFGLPPPVATTPPVPVKKPPAMSRAGAEIVRAVMSRMEAEREFRAKAAKRKLRRYDRGIWNE